MKIKQTIKDYINHTNNDPEYLDLIQNNPQSLFSTIDEKILTSWRKRLKLKCPITLQADRNKEAEWLAKKQELVKKETIYTNISEECVDKRSKILI